MVDTSDLFENQEKKKDKNNEQQRLDYFRRLLAPIFQVWCWAEEAEWTRALFSPPDCMLKGPL
jgi:hypothetical protein